MTTRTPEFCIKAYRVPGGAIVRVIRRGTTHRYRVGKRRFLWLRSELDRRMGGFWSGYYGRSTLDLTRWSA